MRGAVSCRPLRPPREDGRGPVRGSAEMMNFKEEVGNLVLRTRLAMECVAGTGSRRARAKADRRDLQLRRT